MLRLSGRNCSSEFCGPTNFTKSLYIRQTELITGRLNFGGNGHQIWYVLGASSKRACSRAHTNTENQYRRYNFCPLFELLFSIHYHRVCGENSFCLRSLYLCVSLPLSLSPSHTHALSLNDNTKRTNCMIELRSK